jgi:ectoine hydroxylase-related dioxygenase (phytanoyl-CoA dioxygenase family)
MTPDDETDTGSVTDSGLVTGPDIAALCRHFETDGYAIADGSLVDPSTLNAAQEAMNAVRDGHFDTGVPPSGHPGYDPTKLCKINDAHLASHALHTLVTDPAVAQLAAAVTGARRIQVWATQLLIKPPATAAAGHVGWHQDRQYWRYWAQPQGLFTIWMALSDVDADCGPMRFVRGSHRWGLLNQGNFFGGDQQALRDGIDMPEGESWEEVSALMPAGGVSFHHCLTFHGSEANRSDRPRCSVAVHLRTEAVEPIPGDESYYVSHLDDTAYAPVIYEAGE